MWTDRHSKASTQCSRYYENKVQITNKHNCSPSTSLLPADKAACRGDKHIDSHSVRAPSHTTQADTKQFSTKVDETTGGSGHGTYFYTLTYVTHESNLSVCQTSVQLAIILQVN